MNATSHTPTSEADGPRTKVLVVGASGWLGRKITREITAAGHSVRVGLRHGTAHPDAADLGSTDGVQVAELDLTRTGTLPAAVDGIDVVVSAIQGGPEQLVDGQQALARAGVAAGVRRMFPSDYAVDFTAIPDEDHLFFSWRRQGQQAVAEAGMPQTNTYNGAFAEMLLPNPFLALIDWDDAVVNHWGSPDQIYDFTETDDVARYVAAAAVDPDAPEGPLRIAGDSSSPADLALIAGTIAGREFTLRQQGSLAELDAEIDRLRAGAPEDPNAWVGLQYLRSMASGVGRLHDLHNGRYPHITPAPLAVALSRQSS